LPDVLPLAKKKNMKRREQTNPNALYEVQYELQQSEDDDGDHNVLQPKVQFASLKEQALVYDDIPDDDPKDYHDLDVEQGSPEEVADAIEGLIMISEQAGMYRHGVQSLRQ
jgi:hypothetical protein